MSLSISSGVPSGFTRMGGGAAPASARSPAVIVEPRATAGGERLVSPTDTQNVLRAMREAFLARRLETAEKIVETMRPYQSLVTTARTARPMAATLGFVAREIESVVREMGGELDRRIASFGPGALQPEAGAFKGLAGLVDRAERTMTSTSVMLRFTAGVYDPHPLPGRGTVYSLVVEGTRPLLDAWDQLKGISQRLTAMQNRIDLTA